MKHIRKALLVLAVFLSVGVTAMLLTPEAATVESGSCGSKVTYVLDDSGTLTISGTGRMMDYWYSTDVPWYSKRSSIKTVVIKTASQVLGNLHSMIATD